MNTHIHKRFLYIRSVTQFYQRYSGENISLTVSKKLFPDVFTDFPTFFSQFLSYLLNTYAILFTQSEKIGFLLWKTLIFLYI